MSDVAVPQEILLHEKKCALAFEDIEDTLKSIRKYAIRDLSDKLKVLEEFAKDAKIDVRRRTYEPLDYMFYTMEECLGKLVGQSYGVYDSIRTLKASCHVFRDEHHLLKK
jgi:c-di-AMP phosphodiesterase-like protein